MAKHALEAAGWKVVDSGYMLMTDTGDLGCQPPPGASPKEFGPVITPCNLPPWTDPGDPNEDDSLPSQVL